MQKPIRVLICGPSGVGKTELSNYISLALGIPFVTTSTKPLWKAFDVESHRELINMATEDPERSNRFQQAVLEYREKALVESINKNPKGYVADRSPIDNLVYYIMQNTLHTGEEETDLYRLECIRALSLQADKIIRIRFTPNQGDVPDDGMRVANRFYQQQVEAVFQSIFTEDTLDLTHLDSINPKKDILVIDTWNWNERIKMVQNFLGIDRNLIQKIWDKRK